MPTTLLLLAIFIVLSAVPFWLLRGKLPPFRFSSLTAFALMTIVGLGIAVVLQWRELGPLRAEVRQMRTELGRLSIDDPSQVQAIEVRQPDPNLWRWRVYLPPGGQYKLCSFGGILPARGSQSNREWLNALKSAGVGISSSEFSNFKWEDELNFEASLISFDGRWKFETHPGGESRYSLTDNWPADIGRYQASDIWETRQRTFSPGEPIVLLYLAKPVKAATPGGGTQTSVPTEPEEGIALWLEQTPP